MTPEAWQFVAALACGLAFALISLPGLLGRNK